MGLASAAMMRSDKYCQYPIACLSLWIRPAILLEQIHFFFDEGGHFVGYLTWALLAEDTEHRLINDADVLFHISEWNEGDRLWILDFVVTNKSIRKIIKEAFELFPNFGEAKSLRRTDDGAVRKISTWRRR